MTAFLPLVSSAIFDIVRTKIQVPIQIKKKNKDVVVPTVPDIPVVPAIPVVPFRVLDCAVFPRPKMRNQLFYFVYFGLLRSQRIVVVKVV